MFNNISKFNHIFKFKWQKYEKVIFICLSPTYWYASYRSGIIKNSDNLFFTLNIIKLKVSDYPIQNGRIDKWIIEALSSLNLSILSQCGLIPKTAILGLILKLYL